MAGPAGQAECRLAGPREEAEPDAVLAWVRKEAGGAAGGQVMPGVGHRREQRQGSSDVGPVRYDEELIVALPGHRCECDAEPGGKVGAVLAVREPGDVVAVAPRAQDTVVRVASARHYARLVSRRRLPAGSRLR